MGEGRTDTEGQPERIKRFSLVEVLEPLASEEIAWLSQRTPERTFQRGELVYAAEDASEVVFLLLAGRIRLYGIAAGREEFTFEVLQAGTLFGEVSLAGRAHPEYAQALAFAGWATSLEYLLGVGERKPGSKREGDEAASYPLLQG